MTGTHHRTRARHCSVMQNFRKIADDFTAAGSRVAGMAMEPAFVRLTCATISFIECFSLNK